MQCSFSYSRNVEQKEQLEQKHLHLLQILDSERQAKWHYVQQTEELSTEVKKLKNEVTDLKLRIVSPITFFFCTLVFPESHPPVHPSPSSPRTNHLLPHLLECRPPALRPAV